MLNISNNISFKGKAVIAGSVKDLRQIDEYYHNAYFKDVFDYREMRKNPDIFYDYGTNNLTGIYDSNQMYAEMLYVTNEDYPDLQNYYRKQPAVKMLTGEESPEESMLIALDNCKRLSEKMKPYNKSLKSEDSKNNYLIDLYLKAKNTLVEIFGEEKAETVEKIKAAEALEAMEKDSFDFVNCRIIK